jgi:SPP1 family predicted phage head-tail adaptor|nr:MAG TPA: head closure knob [Caudoviricetes sp.]DAS04637.1 MAG TPA: head closure knob [Caudoviricetes sp.]
MDKSEVLYLITLSHKKNANGVFISTETKRRVFCSADSVSQTEFFSAGLNGLKAQRKFTLFRFDYNDEEVIEFKGKRYTVYRTYEKDDDIELYTELRKGNE